VVLSLALVARPAAAVRPFVTDDAHVVGAGHVQLESWFRGDPNTMQHWAVAAVGPNDRMELSVGFVHGANNATGQHRYSISGPLVQGKFLIFHVEPNRWPGLAVAFGFLPPWGTGGFEPTSITGFAYLALTESLFDKDRVLLHLNLGYFGATKSDSLAPDDPRGTALAALTWGVGTEIRIVGPWHAIGELYSGDPYARGGSGAVQGGFRFFFSDHLQWDVTTGAGVFGDTPSAPFFGSGVRLVSHALW
jgi:hypothetical protein